MIRLHQFHPSGNCYKVRLLLKERQAKGYAALEVLDGELARRPFLAGAGYSIADIALYAYTHVAHEGGFDLGRFAAVRAWLERVKGQPRHLELEARP